MTRDVMILMEAYPFRGPLKGVAKSVSECHLGPKKSRMVLEMDLPVCGGGGRGTNNYCTYKFRNQQRIVKCIRNTHSAALYVYQLMAASRQGDVGAGL